MGCLFLGSVALFKNQKFIQFFCENVTLFLHMYADGVLGWNRSERWVKISRFYTGSGGFLCVFQTGGLAEQWSGKIKSVGKVAVLM